MAPRLATGSDCARYFMASQQTLAVDVAGIGVSLAPLRVAVGTAGRSILRVGWYAQLRKHLESPVLVSQTRSQLLPT
jgi:hypothetical protein